MPVCAYLFVLNAIDAAVVMRKSVLPCAGRGPSRRSQIVGLARMAADGLNRAASGQIEQFGTSQPCKATDGTCDGAISPLPGPEPL
jgi:hypothetical protein